MNSIIPVSAPIPDPLNIHERIERGKAIARLYCAAQHLSHVASDDACRLIEEAYGTCTDTLIWYRLLLGESGLPSFSRENSGDPAYDSFMGYILLLKNHDWAFEYSDDGKVAKAGRESLSLINNLQPTLDPVFKIWNEFCHPNYKRKAST